MKAVYPVIMSKCNRDYYPYFIDIPDFNISLHAEDPYTGIQASRMRICDEIDELQRMDKHVPDSNYIIPTSYQADVITLIDINTDEKDDSVIHHQLLSFH